MPAGPTAPSKSAIVHAAGATVHGTTVEARNAWSEPRGRVGTLPLTAGDVASEIAESLVPAVVWSGESGEVAIPGQTARLTPVLSPLA